MPDRILITTDDLEHAVRINAGVEAAGFHTTLAHTLDEARQALRRDPPPDCVVVTGGLHESGAAQLLTLARDRSVSTLGLVEETEPDAKGLARRLGLTGYLEKPADPPEVPATVRRLIERRKLQQRTGTIGESPAIQEGLAKIEEMAPATQVKTLRVLEDRTFFRVGGTQAIKVDVRVIAATNKALKEEVALGRFRDDLFYRLNVLYIYLPPLRERKTDIPLLVRRFTPEFARQHDRPFRGITPEALQILVDAEWPGNIRQLRNLIESMVVLAPEGEIRASDIPKDIREHGSMLPMRLLGPGRDVGGAGGAGVGTGAQELEFIFRSLVELKLQVEELRRRLEERPPRVEVIEVGPGSGVSAAVTSGVAEAAREADVVYRPGMTMADVERAAIEAALRETQGNRRKAAEVLGIGERTLYRKLKAYALV